MRIVFIGAVEFSRATLAAVLEAGGNVVGVLTLAPEAAGFHSDYADLGPLAERHNVSVFRIRDVGDRETVELIRRLKPDVIFVFGWSRLIPAEVLELPPLGCVGTHPALLPEHRGRHPIVWALAEGLEESGLTFFYLDETADSGDILWQRPFAIDPEDDAAALYAKIEALAVEAIREFLPELEAGTASRTPQDAARASYWRKRTDADRRIDWGAPTASIHNLVRALARPYVGALAELEGRPVIVWRARRPAEEPDREALESPSGTVVARRRDAVDVRTGDSVITLLEIEAP